METLALFPLDARVDERGQLWLGGCQVYRQALAQHYPGSGQVAYASKAYVNLALAQLFAGQGLSLDVVSGGELYLALRAGFPTERIHFARAHWLANFRSGALAEGCRFGSELCQGDAGAVGL